MTAPVKNPMYQKLWIKNIQAKICPISTIPLKPGQSERGSYVQKKLYPCNSTI